MTSGARTVIDTPLFRVLAWMRYALLALTLMVNLARIGDSPHPVLVALGSVLLVALSVVAHWAYSAPERRDGWVLAGDVSATALLCALSPLVLDPAQGIPLTGFWTAAAPIAIAVSRGWLAGGLAALVLCLLSFLQDPEPSPEVLGLMIALVIGAAGLGYLVDQLRDVTAERDRLNANAALLSERQRLARIVHDGVLQVLAMVEREGPNLGPRGALLARLARQQEGQLRALILDNDLDPSSRDPRDITHRNFANTLDRHASATVTVSTPAEPLLMESARSAELDAAISEALKNVAKHAGPDARAWVLLEVEGPDAVVSIRDNGVGGDPNQFAAAMRNGRLGMKHSIYGRIHDLGGTATLRTAPGRGVEWEYRVPIER